jgi:hypothetical protein
MSLHLKAGEISLPSQVYFVGIASPSRKASLVIGIFTIFSSLHVIVSWSREQAAILGGSVSIKAMVAATKLVIANLLSFHSPFFVDDSLRALESGAAPIAAGDTASLSGIQRRHTRPPSFDGSVRARTHSELE